MHETEGQKKLIFSLLVFIFSSSNVRVIAPLLRDVTEPSPCRSAEGKRTAGSLSDTGAFPISCQTALGP